MVLQLSTVSRVLMGSTFICLGCMNDWELLPRGVSKLWHNRSLPIEICVVWWVGTTLIVFLLFAGVPWRTWARASILALSGFRVRGRISERKLNTRQEKTLSVRPAPNGSLITDLNRSKTYYVSSRKFVRIIVTCGGGSEAFIACLCCARVLSDYVGLIVAMQVVIW